LQIHHHNHPCIYLLPHACHMPRQSQPPEFDHPGHFW
jgi:hypothetical protein